MKILNNNKPAFSLMETMIVLLIVSILAAASAPMIAKKLSNKTLNPQQNPWIFTESDDNIAYLGDTALIGAATVKVNDNNNTPKMYIQTQNENHPHLSFGISGSNDTIKLTVDSANQKIGFNGGKFAKNSIFLTPDTDDAGAESVIALGFHSTTNAAQNSISIGKVSVSNKYATAIGHDATTNGKLALAIGAPGTVTNANEIEYLHYGNVCKIWNQSTGGQGSACMFVPKNKGIKDKNSSGTNETKLELKKLADEIAQGLAGTGNNPNYFGWINNKHDSNTMEPKAGEHWWWGVQGSKHEQITALVTTTINPNAQDEACIAIGSAEASNKKSISIGRTTKADGENAIAIGQSQEFASEDTKTIANGDNSIAIGYNAKSQYENSIAIGNKIGTTETNQIILGNSNHTVFIPGNLVVNGDTYLRIGGTDGKVYKILRKDVGGELDSIGWIPNINDTDTYSDRRLKNVGEKYTAGIEELKKLEFFHYTFKKDKSQTPRVGVMAQDLQKVFPDAVKEGEDGFLRIRMEDMFYAVINAVKELDVKITEIVAQIKVITEDITGMKAKIEAQEKEIQELEKQNAELMDSIKSIEKRLKKLEKKNKD